VKARAVAGAAAWLLLAGCATPSEPIRALAADPRLLAGDLPDARSVIRDVEVRVVSHVIFWVPTSGQPPTVEEALAEALDRGRGDVLLNATVDRVAWYVPLLYGEYGWVVRGDVVRLRDRRPHPFDVEPGSGDAAGLPAPVPHERPAAPPPGP
jgi:hypothetical protein